MSIDKQIAECVAAQDWAGADALLAGLAADAPVSASLAGNAYKAYTALKNDARAEHWLDRALALAPQSATHHRNKGLFHQKRNEWAEALAAFERAIAIRPDLASYLAAAAFAAFQLERYDLAATHYTAAVAIDPSQRGWWLRLARARVICNELPLAADAYRQALALQEDKVVRSAYSEVLRQIRDGSRAASSAYYDAVFAESPKYAVAGTESEYADVWERLVGLMAAAGTQAVLDMGCGPGQFAEFIAARLPALRYAGLDFSEVAVSGARRRCPQFLFERRELPLATLDGLPGFDTVVCTEVLEHVERDVEIIDAVPAGRRIFATVPNFDAFGHLRTFKTEDAVRERYGTLFESLAVEARQLSAANVLWILHGVRNGTRATADVPATGAPAKVAADGILIRGPAIVECVMWSDGSRYVADFLSSFGLPFVTVDTSRNLREPHVALRHDVDWSIENAWAMAQLEHQHGIRSSYYLLHPDGIVTPENYFGRVVDGRLEIAPSLFDWAARLVDLGHEIGLHNDLISLALATGRQPGEFLEQIVEAFTARGMPLTGSVAHGSRLCREHAYMNYQVFADLRDHIAVDYRNTPELFARFAEPEVQRGEHRVEKFTLKMADYGLAYEVNFVPWEIYVSDSSARWTLWHHESPTVIEKHAPRAQFADALTAHLEARSPMSAVQCLVHACHWSVLSHHNPPVLPSIRKRRAQVFGLARREAILARLASFPNVPLARAGNERFDGYDQDYSTKPQLYSVTTAMNRFMDQVLALHAGPVSSVLEVGCGQGDFLAGVHDRITARQPGAHVRACGIDGSLAAIVTCAGRYPKLAWVADELEHFLDVHDEVLRGDDGIPTRHDLVLDKTGAIFIEDYATACAFFERTARLMQDGALYVYIASRHYFEENLRKKTYAGWPEHWMQIAARVFEPAFQEDDDSPELRGYYKRAYRKRD